MATLQRAAGGEAQCRYCKLLPRSWVQSQGTPGLMSHAQQLQRAGGSATQYKNNIENIKHSAAKVQATVCKGRTLLQWPQLYTSLYTSVSQPALEANVPYSVPGSGWSPVWGAQDA